MMILTMCYMFGDIASLPAADAGGSALTSSYYTDSQVSSQTQNERMIGYNQDPAGRFLQPDPQPGGSANAYTYTYTYGDPIFLKLSTGICGFDDDKRSRPYALPDMSKSSSGPVRCRPLLPTTSPTFTPTHPRSQERGDRDSHHEQREGQQRDPDAVCTTPAPYEKEHAARSKQTCHQRVAPEENALAPRQLPTPFLTTAPQAAHDIAKTHHLHIVLRRKFRVCLDRAPTTTAIF